MCGIVENDKNILSNSNAIWEKFHVLDLQNWKADEARFQDKSAP